MFSCRARLFPGLPGNPPKMTAARPRPALPGSCPGSKKAWLPASSGQLPGELSVSAMAEKVLAFLPGSAGRELAGSAGLPGSAGRA